MKGCLRLFSFLFVYWIYYNFRIANALTILFFINTFRNSKKHHRFGYHKKSQMQD